MKANATRLTAWIALGAFVYLGSGVLEPLSAWGDGVFDHYIYVLVLEPDLLVGEPKLAVSSWLFEPPAAVPIASHRRPHAPRGPPA